MTQREFVQGGLKLIGVWILITGVLALINSLYSGTISFLALKHSPHISSIGILAAGGQTPYLMGT